MLPATLAQEVRKQVLHYLQATFRLRDHATEKALEAFFNDPENGLFKGPWVQVRRPFRLDSGNISGLFDIEIPYVPFRHQAMSWRRLTTRGDNQPQHTLVTTGTGSGKTECFLYPVLDHCQRMHQAGKRDGIKAIILYPMNALAADQAGRFAEEILKSPLLSDMVAGKPKARVRVGLYTGRMTSSSSKEGGAEPDTYVEVTRESAKDGSGGWTYKAITNREAMQADPPDILLTNYKMLDYLLLRPKDVSIWRHNQAEPSLLRYLVLDELHTYDGAQGADVACLLRRLKERFSIPRGQLCMVGTSATVSGGDDESNLGPMHKLCHFASTLFEESITDEAVIQEDRYRVDEVVRVPELEIDTLPPAEECGPRHREDAVHYAYRMAALFGGPAYPVEIDDPNWPEWTPHYSTLKASLAKLDDHTRWGVALGEWIRWHPLFQRLLVATQEAPAHWLELLRELAREDFAFRSVGGLAERGEVLMAFLALVAQARELRSGKAFPLVPTQVQLWLRELRRIGALVHEDPSFAWLDNPSPEGRHQLPVVHCTECGELAWVGLRDLDADAAIEQHGIRGMQLSDEVPSIYEAWGFEGYPKPTLVMLSPWREGDDPTNASGQQELEGLRWHLSPGSLVLREGPGACPLTEERTFPVKVVHEHDHRNNGQRIGVRRCPHCQTLDSLMFIGSRAATIASVAIDEVFGSVLNSDPKLLAFTDSVQDASHRAGFFSARTYHFTLRTALQHLIDEAGEEGIALPDVGERLLAFWAEPAPGRPGTMKESMATLMPPDLREYEDYLDYRDSSAQTPAAGLFEEVAKRLTWEATSEFSLMLTHGRTMESHASATLGWDPSRINDTLGALRQRFPRISPRLEELGDEVLRLWVLGMLHRQRERGGLHHLYLSSYARQNYWGKYPFGKVVKGRETFPPQGRYQPRLWTTHPDRRHDHILVPPRDGQMQPWQIVWARRVLGLPGVDDATLVDLLAAFLEAGESAGLLHKLHQDGDKAWYAVSDAAARLYPEGEKLLSSSGYYLYRPSQEALLWQDAPSLSYQDAIGRYRPAELNERENYYRTRYRKGALRRVFAHEHTGLLDTPEREGLEANFNDGSHADDPNVLTATSTLEMGIDIGDLSTTMLCSIPPSAASYLQRIGRAGRKTGTALILSVINQRPHDLFFYARPEALLAGEIEPPGCWLDASAVLVRQYLAFCFDQAVREGVLIDLPGTGKQLVDEVVQNRAGHIPGLLAWMLEHEEMLQQRFMARFAQDAKDDTRQRFLGESRAERLREAIERAASEFQLQRQLLDNARKRLRDQRNKLEPASEALDLAEIEREERILRARQRKLNEIGALEVLTEHGLLPNYAFPERGVRFSGAIYHRRPKGEDGEVIETRPPIELVRSGAQAIRELAPGNHFYTHSHRFAIQQIELGSRNQPLLGEWAICGQCGHMRLAAEVHRPEAVPACPQCGHDGPESQTEKGQTRNFLQFARSQAVSYMEYYDSLSADKGEERENERYQLVTSFDQTVEQASGAVGNDAEPFGIEYRSAMVMRQVNAGYQDQYRDLAFGQEKVSSEGFLICADCGMAAEPGQGPSEVRHRRSCSGHRESQRRHREGRQDDAYRWEHVFLYRELRSEAVRLLLPDVEPEDLSTLEAAIYLGMRLRFQGDPGHLLVQQQIVPNLQLGVTQHYLVLMDAVPGGTGFLKALFQEVDDEGRAGEGVMDVLRRSLAALEHCTCRELHQTEDDTDGCYRCLRTYHLQYRADQISREQGIRLLRRLIAAGETRESKQELDEIKPRAMFGSVLEKRFVNRLRDWVVERGKEDDWREVLIGGTRGFEFTLGDGRIWSLQLQPLLGSAQGVSVGCQPDFLLRPDDDICRPIAIFLDGFEFHVKPHEAEPRLADDFLKRRAILDSQRYWVWSLSWDDLDQLEGERFRFLAPRLTDEILPKRIKAVKFISLPALPQVSGNAFQQFKAFLLSPEAAAWQWVGQDVLGLTLMMLAGKGLGQDAAKLRDTIPLWRSGYAVPPIAREDSGDWVWLARNVALTDDMLVYSVSQDLLGNDFTRVQVELRLGDSEQERSAVETFRLRWRRFHALANLFQFVEKMLVFTTSEIESGVIPEPLLMPEVSLGSQWQGVVEGTLSSLEKLVHRMAAEQCALPEVEHYSDDLGGEPFAEMAWPEASPPVALLVGDQASFVTKWHQAGWRVLTDKDLQTHGEAWCVEQLPKHKAGDE
ncbi:MULTISPECIES: DEAD/DEAH box helicase [Cobetia]|uniref:DEAD/DEAH box helicase n=1 Tax=Cobetia TaxID=204286 RepID=UPI001583D5F1|nr:MULTISPECIES: DEAD/DEAH box helicase [Cobetia]MDI4662609.1 DEAD/DEAH box helicase [Cobetia sp. BMC6]NUJ57829.1 DEAD/DEAH box helicase [Cobetia marina]